MGIIPNRKTQVKFKNLMVSREGLYKKPARHLRDDRDRFYGFLPIGRGIDIPAIPEHNLIKKWGCNFFSGDNPIRDKEIPQFSEKEVVMDRIGVFVCGCGPNISEKLSVADLQEFSGSLAAVAEAKSHSLLCSAEGREFLRQEIHDHHLDKVVIAA